MYPGRGRVLWPFLEGASVLSLLMGWRDGQVRCGFGGGRSS
jgi:hypothetical protein